MDLDFYRTIMAVHLLLVDINNTALLRKFSKVKAIIVQTTINILGFSIRVTF